MVLVTQLTRKLVTLKIHQKLIKATLTVLSIPFPKPFISIYVYIFSLIKQQIAQIIGYHTKRQHFLTKFHYFRPENL